ncbi:L-type lectin-domain containing receptor kinase IX.1 [Cryptomeria japonica]|uniref:L-type lectin-domain containing receptor kinase IX.1 n=1 Tax=Cryptomeria japonica TaxID=3369 RepID=UPI0027DA046C|nr:L-type lectin-domain containing receptor kinase IX.1 [Cryptomeria japonica]
MSFFLAFLTFYAATCVAPGKGESSLSFSFPSFDNSHVDHIKLLYDSYFQQSGDGNLIELTTDRSGKTYSVGWAVFDKSIPVWNKSSGALATFSTHFEFRINPSASNEFGSGGGMAFFMAPLDFQTPVLSAGKWLGLFNSSTIDNPRNQIVAVEFDTDKNSHDPDDNHVGIDVNTVVSEKYYSVVNGSLKDGKRWDAWVDYDGRVKKLQVFLSRNASKSAAPVLSYDIDLANFLPENVMAGFSASTSMGTESHALVSWNLTCKTSWNASFLSLADQGKGKSKRKGFKSVLIAVIIATAAIFCGFTFAGVWLWRRRRHRRRTKTERETEMALDEEFTQGPRKFTYAELNAATRHFSESEKLGQGGFGYVYRGVFPGTNEIVAVKRISEASKQGKKEYVAEVSIITRLGHRNLVQLLGWCHERGELLLVYEYMPNGSLDKRIFESGALDWNRRYNIASGIASALVYLHEDWDQCILHRDIKSSNVMLDSNFNAKLGDFGLARLVERDTEAFSHTTVVAGTLGYLAPECVITGKSTPESDVYSFGAVALEIACGRRALDQRLRENYSMRLVQWVWDLYSQGRVLDAAAESLRGEFNREEMERLLMVGLWCSHPDPEGRPSMRQVVKALRFEETLPNIPTTIPVPVFFYGHPVRPSDVLSTTSLYGTSSDRSQPVSTVVPR